MYCFSECIYCRQMYNLILGMCLWLKLALTNMCVLLLLFCVFLCCCSGLAKKTQSVIQTLRKDGVITTELEQNLKNCRSADELDHVVRITFSYCICPLILTLIIISKMYLQFYLRFAGSCFTKHQTPSGVFVFAVFSLQERQQADKGSQG